MLNREHAENDLLSFWLFRKIHVARELSNRELSSLG